MEIQNLIKEILFENEVTSKNPYLTLSKMKMTDEQIKQLLGIRPGEINIILARTVEFLTEDHPGKTKKDVITEILDVLARSPSARRFISTGAKESYTLFKGFPVRKGDQLASMPDIGSEITLPVQETFLSWSSDATKAREQGAQFDPTKGDPIGGLLVQTTADVSKILFDINAVINAVKSNYDNIQNYNLGCEPGKAISKSNSAYLATKAPYYSGQYEVIMPTKYSAAKIEDKWLWKQNGENKTVQWQASDKQEDPQEPEEDKQSNEKMKENNYNVFLESNSFNINPLDEGMMDYIKKGAEFVSRKAGIGIRGKTLKYLDKLMEQYESQRDIFKYAIDFIKYTKHDNNKIDKMNEQIDQITTMINNIFDLRRKIEDNPNIDLNFASETK